MKRFASCYTFTSESTKLNGWCALTCIALLPRDSRFSTRRRRRPCSCPPAERTADLDREEAAREGHKGGRREGAALARLARHTVPRRAPPAAQGVPAFDSGGSAAFSSGTHRGGGGGGDGGGDDDDCCRDGDSNSGECFVEDGGEAAREADSLT
jgi:hypothetical protein